MDDVQFNSVTMSKCVLKSLTFYLFPLLARIAESQNVSCQNIRMLENYSPYQNRRMFEKKYIISVSRGFHCQLNLSFCSDDEKETFANLTVACHRHHIEKNETFFNLIKLKKIKTHLQRFYASDILPFNVEARCVLYRYIGSASTLSRFTLPLVKLALYNREKSENTDSFFD